MTKLMSLLEAAAKFQAMGRDMDRLGPAIVARACEMVCAEAKRVIGTHDYDWLPLSPATLAHKTADTPLLETGGMRASIEWQSKGNEGQVGSNDDKAVWQELGTSRIPPRSFLMQAAMHMEKPIHKMAGRATLAALSSGALFSPELREVMHLLHRAGHEVKDAVEEITKEDEGRSRDR